MALTMKTKPVLISFIDIERRGGGGGMFGLNLLFLSEKRTHSGTGMSLLEEHFGQAFHACVVSEKRESLDTDVYNGYA